MIPKIVHYCWFGSDKPGKIRRRIESWKKLLPDYEIWEWNEKNFDVYSIPYTSARHTGQENTHLSVMRQGYMHFFIMVESIWIWM